MVYTAYWLVITGPPPTRLLPLHPSPHHPSLKALLEMLFSLLLCLVTQSCLTLCDPMDWCPSGPSVGFPRQEYWSKLLFPSPGYPPDPGIKPASPALASRFFTSEPPGKSFRRNDILLFQLCYGRQYSSGLTVWRQCCLLGQIIKSHTLL